jgi:hypothetical protein
VKGALGLAISGTHYLYADDGTSPGGIDVFALSGSAVTFLQHVTVGASNSGFYGAHHLALTTYTAGSPARSYSCLAFASDGNGTVYSFQVASNGFLVASPASSVVVGGYPSDLAASGSVLFESNIGSHVGGTNTLDVLSFGPGCTLSLTHQTSTGSEQDINIALINANQVTSADFTSGNLVIYSLGPGGALTESAVQPGQLPGFSASGGSSAPQSTAAWNTVTSTGVVTNVYTGQATSGSPPQAQGYRLGAGPFDALKGSPQTDSDPSSFAGAAVSVDSAHKLLVQADQGSGQIGWYKLTAGSTATVGSIAFGGDTPLAITNDQPFSIAVFGSDLFVAQTFGGDVEDCALASTGVSGCRTIATLTGAGSGVGGSVAIK